MKKISFAILFMLFCIVQGYSQSVEFTIKWESPHYVVYMKSATGYTMPYAQIPTSQVTVVAPNGTGANKFVVTNLVSHQASMPWSQNARVDAPVENPNADYISFGFQGATSFNIPANTEIKLFSFDNGGNCLGALQLFENFSDPFSNLTPPDYANSANTNPGNAITIFGAGGDDYLGNYGAGANACPAIGMTIQNPPIQNALVNQPKSGNSATELNPQGGNGPYTYSNGSGEPGCVAPSGATALPGASNFSINSTTGVYTYTAPPVVGKYYYCVKVCDSSTPASCQVGVYTLNVTCVPYCSNVVTVQKN